MQTAARLASLAPHRTTPEPPHPALGRVASATAALVVLLSFAGPPQDAPCSRSGKPEVGDLSPEAFEETMFAQTQEFTACRVETEWPVPADGHDLRRRRSKRLRRPRARTPRAAGYSRLHARRRELKRWPDPGAGIQYALGSHSDFDVHSDRLLGRRGMNDAARARVRSRTSWARVPAGTRPNREWPRCQGRGS
jgi:hypothetical protein